MQPNENTSARVTGLFLLLLSLGAGYYLIYMPIAAAWRGTLVRYSPAVGIVPLGLLFGLFLLVSGARGRALLERKPSVLALSLLIAITLLIMFGCLFGMGIVLQSVAYD